MHKTNAVCMVGQFFFSKDSISDIRTNISGVAFFYGLDSSSADPRLTIFRLQIYGMRDSDELLLVWNFPILRLGF